MFASFVTDVRMLPEGTWLKARLHGRVSPRENLRSFASAALIQRVDE